MKVEHLLFKIVSSIDVINRLYSEVNDEKGIFAKDIRIQELRLLLEFYDVNLFDRAFKCRWDLAMYGDKPDETQNIFFFSDTNGYDEDDFDAIIGLGVGKTLELEGHKIRRIK